MCITNAIYINEWKSQDKRLKQLNFKNKSERIVKATRYNCKKLSLIK